MVIRPAVPADALAVARVHVRAWQAGYQGLLPAAYREARRAARRAGVAMATPSIASIVGLPTGQIAPPWRYRLTGFAL